MLLRVKLAEVRTPLQPHQQRVIDKLKASGGLLVAHGVGSGKTLSSIAAADALGLPIEAVVPAPLVANYEKELAKHLDKVPEDTRIRSYEKAVRDKDINLDALAVMDEAHRARNAGTQTSKVIAGQVAKAKARLLLTGTPVYNQPHDLAVLLNTAAGRRLLPDNPALFKSMFVGQEKIRAPFMTRMKGKVLGRPVEDSIRNVLVNRQRLVDAAKGYVDVHKGGGEGFPDREDAVHHVEMSPRQLQMYQFHTDQMPWYLKAKIQAGLPLDKKESSELNAFQGALRQVSNTPRPYAANMSEEEEVGHTPKIQLMAQHLQEMHAQDPNFRGVVYSNYLNAGLQPLSRSLSRAGIKHHVFTGEVSKKQRDEMVRDYNEGKVPVLLLSGAGAEGLDLRGTKAIQVMEPHWNESRINQVIGRGIRYKSHEHLPEGERKVKVLRYMSTLPKKFSDKFNWLTGGSPDQSVEEYMKNMAEEKERFGGQLSGALQEASDYGPLRKLGFSSEKENENLQKKFDAYTKLLRERGVYSGTAHKRITIPKSKLSKDDIARLGFEEVLLAIPEAGQDQFRSFRHPENLFHIHSHPGSWTMHEDSHPSSTMLSRKMGPLKAFIQGVPHVVTEGLPGLGLYLAGQIAGRKSTADKVRAGLDPDVVEAIEKQARLAVLRQYGVQ